MRKLEIGTHKNNLGFTLLELLVVLVIIGITATFAVLSTGDFGHSRKIRIQAEQILESLHYAQYYAILKPTLIRMRIIDHQLVWQVPTHKPKPKWQTIASDKILSSQALYQHVQLDSEALEKQPGVIINSAGYIYPFNLLVKDKHSPLSYLIRVDKDNEFHIEETQ